MPRKQQLACSLKRELQKGQKAKAKHIGADAALTEDEKRQRLTQLEQRRHAIAQRVMGRKAISASAT